MESENSRGGIEIDKEISDSVELSKTQKGTYTWKIKRYFGWTNGKIDDVVSELKRLDELLKKYFGE